MLNLDENPKLRKTDRILVLRPMDGTKAKSSTGLVDPRLFSGGNTLHVIQNERTTLWSFRYDVGGLPDPLKESFTSFAKALEHAKNYFKTRNIEIKEIID